MGDSRDLCPHLDSIGEVTKDDLLLKSKATCQSCGVAGPNLWACLQVACPYVGCGESFADHSTLHAQAKKHNLTVNLTTFRVWCYACEKEVFPEPRLAAHLPGSSHKFFEQDSPLASHPLKAIPVAVADEGESDSEDDDLKPRGLTGMKNLGNSCYMNAALQALSNCPPLTQFFLECGGLVRTDKKPALCKSYQKLVSEVWHRKRPSCVVPASLSHGIKLVNPMFRGYAQQDTQEFLRCLMDQLHEELKEPVVTAAATLTEPRDSDSSDSDDKREGDRSPSEDEFLSCDSSSDRGEGDGQGRGGSSSQAETELLSPDEAGRAISEKERRKDRKFSWGQQRTSSEQVDEDADVDTAMAALVPQPAEAQPPSPRSTSPCRTPEPDNEAHMRSASRPCSPVHHHEGHAKLASSPARASPVRLGPSYVLKKAQVPSAGSRRRKEQRYRSVISDIFDGSILSLVQCLTCDRVSTTVETFQDLSLPIPGKEDLAKLHSAIYQNVPAKSGACGDSYAAQGWLAFIVEYIRRFVVSCTPSWFWGPVVTLEDCLAAFFAADELKGDNMYSCERCKKLRNGVKYCKVLRLPEILCIHLKRFRHEVMYSFKISSHVSFPLEGLDLRPFLAKECTSQISTYDLLSVICHHGTAGSGHYIAYCQNVINGQWYEFDDQYVTKVHETVVQSAEAYVLFYRKSSEEAVRERQQVVSLAAKRETSLLRFYVSREWLNKFNTFAEPGPITNYTFLCSHGGIPPNKYHYIDDLVVILPQDVWEYLYNRSGAEPVGLSEPQSKMHPKSRGSYLQKDLQPSFNVVLRVWGRPRREPSVRVLHLPGGDRGAGQAQAGRDRHLHQAEQGLPGRGVPRRHLLHQHAVVPRVGGLCQGQGQRAPWAHRQQQDRTAQRKRPRPAEAGCRLRADFGGDLGLPAPPVRRRPRDRHPAECGPAPGPGELTRGAENRSRDPRRVTWRPVCPASALLPAEGVFCARKRGQRFGNPAV